MIDPRTTTEREVRSPGNGLLGHLLESGDLSAGAGVAAHLDIREPRIGMIVGTRGSGKSHTLGVLAEELMLSQLAIGCVLIDRCGVFTQMDQWNEEEAAPEPGQPPRVRVLTVSHGTGASLQFRPRDLLPDDWCRLTGIAVEGPRSELVSAALHLVAEGYGTADGRKTPRTSDPSVEDLWQCCASAEKLLDAQRGFTLSTRRSVIQKLQALERLDMLNHEAEPIESAVLPGWITVVDISDPRLSEAAATACVGLVARAVLRARFESVKMGQDKLPVTWLLVDEAHLFAGPESGRSRADDDLVQYCKLGRHPGCALVLATQQPGAMNPSILSQVDFAVAHRLTLRSDMDALGKVVPGIDGSVRSRLAGFEKGEALLFENGRVDAPYLSVRDRHTRHNGCSAVPCELSVPPAWQRQNESWAKSAEVTDDGAKDSAADHPAIQYANTPGLQGCETQSRSSDTPLRQEANAIGAQEDDTMVRKEHKKTVLSGSFGIAVILVGFFIGWKATNWIAQRVGPFSSDGVVEVAAEEPVQEAEGDPERDPLERDHREPLVATETLPASVPDVHESPEKQQAELAVSKPVGFDPNIPAIDEGTVAKDAQTRNMNALRYLQ